MKKLIFVLVPCFTLMVFALKSNGEVRLFLQLHNRPDGDVIFNIGCAGREPLSYSNPFEYSVIDFTVNKKTTLKFIDLAQKCSEKFGKGSWAYFVDLDLGEYYPNNRKNAKDLYYSVFLGSREPIPDAFKGVASKKRAAVEVPEQTGAAEEISLEEIFKEAA